MEAGLPRETRVVAGDLQLNLAEGPDAGPSLLLLHGLTARWQTWEALLPSLRQGRHLLAPDLRGHGRSDRGPSYLLADYTGDILALLDHLPRPLDLVGHSLGALTALAVTAARPEAVRSLALIDPPLFIRELPLAAVPGALAYFTWAHETAGVPSFEHILLRCGDWAPAASEAAVSSLAEQLAAVTPEAIQVNLEDRLQGDFDFAEALRTVRVPLLLLRGEWGKGSVVREEDAALVTACAPQATAIQFPGAGHNLHWERREQVARALLDFLG